MTNIFDRIINLNIYVLVALVPLFFLPFSFEIFEFNKQYLLFFLISVSLFCWLAKMALIDKELRFKKTPLDLFILAFLATAVLSAVFSVDRTSSLFGFYGRFSNGLIGVLSLGALYFIVTNNVKFGEARPAKEKEGEFLTANVAKILKVFLFSSSVAVLLSYLAVFGVLARVKVLPMVIKQAIFNPVSASLEGLAVFLAVTAALLVGLLMVGTGKDRTKIIFHWLLLIAILGLIVIIDFTAAWLVLLCTLFLFVGLSIWKRLFKDNVNRLLIPIFLLIIAAAAIPFQSQDVIGSLPREQILDQKTSWAVGLAGAIDAPKNIALGSGIATYHYDFAKEKPLSFNQNWLWQIRFDRAGSHLAEMLATMGFLGLLSYLAIVGLFLMMSYLMLKKAKNTLPWLMLFIALLLAQLIYYQNTTLAFLFWLTLALSVVSWQKPIKEKVVSFKDFPELSLVFSTTVIIIGVAFLGLYFYGVKFYLADMKYAQAQAMPLGAERTANLEKAVRMNPGLAQYRTGLARAYMNQALAEIRKPETEQDAARTQLLVATAINQAKRATELSPNQVANWETLAAVYREIRNVASGAFEWGIKSFETAISLEPSNPVICTELGKLYLVKDEQQSAEKYFLLALEKKSDYIDGLFQLGLVYFNNDRTAEAVEQFQKVISLSPNHSNARYSLAIAYIAQGETDSAIGELEKVLELNPGNQDVIDKLEQLY